MKPEITRSAKAKTGHSLYFNDGPTGMALITTSVERDEVWISMTAKHTEISEPKGVAVTCSPFEAMLAATTIVEAVRDFCPEDFDRLWASFKDTIRRERTPVTNDAPAVYRDGLVPSMDEDRTADVNNAREAEYLKK